MGEKGQERDHSRGCPRSPIEMWGPSSLEVDAESWKDQGSLGMKIEVDCGARKGETWRVNV